MADNTVHEAAHGEADSAAHNENLKFAMWLYLTSEVVIFSMLIAGYAIFRATQVSSVNLVKDALGIGLVTANTFVLLFSSYAMVMGLRAIRMGSRSEFYRWIALTAILGTVFLGGQYVEYSELGHLGISLDKQDFTVDTNIFETVNHVEGVASDVIVWTPAVNEDEERIYVSETVAQLPIEDLRELHHYASVAAIPANLTDAIVVLPPNATGIETVQNDGLLILQDGILERNQELAEPHLSYLSYHVDFDDDAELFNDVDLTTTAINEETRVIVEPLLIDWNDDFILLDEAGAPITDGAAVETAVHEINESLEALQVRQLNRVPLSRLAVQTVDGEVVPFSAILAGQAIDLDQDQYDSLNAYFRALIGDSASGYGMRFYAPTAFHGAHVLIGVLWALFVLWRGSQGAYDKNAIGLELFGLYWHFVDVVWIVLFTLIYLV